MAQKGTIFVEKTGEVFFGVNVFGEEDKDVIYQPVYKVKGLAGAVYEITADEDVITPDGTLRYHKGDVVDTVTTDEDGIAKSKELYLGKYTVVETKHRQVWLSTKKSIRWNSLMPVRMLR